jgi:hypothetical protein
MATTFRRGTKVLEGQPPNQNGKEAWKREPVVVIGIYNT